MPVPTPPPGPPAEAAPAVASAPPTRTDRVVADSARILAAWLYRSLEVHRVEPQPEGPVLALVNHGGGFEDPVVTIAASRRMPRFVARDVIWGVPGAAQVMDAVGAIPIHRRADSATGGVDNHASFEAVTQALADGQLVAIFPEGESIDTPGVHQLRTGAARMALAAHTAGVRGLRIQPTGLHYLDKGGLRSRAFVQVGPALQLDDLLAELGGVPADTPGQHALVRALTAQFTDALRAVSPDFRDWSQARDLQAAAAIALRSAEDSRPSSGILASYGNAARLAALLESAPEDQVEAVTRALRDYEDDLHALGLTDADVAGHTALRGHLARRAAQTGRGRSGCGRDTAGQCAGLRRRVPRRPPADRPSHDGDRQADDRHGGLPGRLDLVRPARQGSATGSGPDPLPRSPGRTCSRPRGR